jgi:predicted amidohydrolase/GNAT superfamily N-acetyltransferase
MSMLPIEFDSPRGRATLRLARFDDIDALVQLNKDCFPLLAEENVLWNRTQLENHQRVFPEGQFVVEIGGRVVGAAAALVVRLGLDQYRPHTYAGITDGGYFHNHDPQGDTLYGADVYVHPDFRGMGVGHQLYEGRRLLCRKLNLRRVVAGGRLDGYAEHAARFIPEEYVAQVEAGNIHDRVLSFQLREGFVVHGVLRNYVRDPRSKNCAALVEWRNPGHRREDVTSGKVRVAAVQYQVRRIETFEEFAEAIEYFVETAFDYRADFVLFPEFTTMQLLSQRALRNLPANEGIERLAKLTDQVLDLFVRLAKTYGINIVAGTHPMRQPDGTLQNVCPLVLSDGRVEFQPKIHITPSERTYWGIQGGSTLRVFNTPRAKVGILVCYDSEFPEAARYLADEGAEILFVPYCTDDRQGYARVRCCCQARAVENQVYVATAGIIGNLPSVAAMDIHYGRAAVFTPSDFEFARDGIQSEADSNVEMLLVTDLDINDLYRSRTAGSVRPRLDRRPDLFEFRAKFSKKPDLVEHAHTFDPVDDAVPAAPDKETGS